MSSSLMQIFILNKTTAIFHTNVVVEKKQQFEFCFVTISEKVVMRRKTIQAKGFSERIDSLITLVGFESFR